MRYLAGIQHQIEGKTRTTRSRFWKTGLTKKQTKLQVGIRQKGGVAAAANAHRKRKAALSGRAGIEHNAETEVKGD